MRYNLEEIANTASRGSQDGRALTEAVLAVAERIEDLTAMVKRLVDLPGTAASGSPRPLESGASDALPRPPRPLPRIVDAKIEDAAR